MPAGQFSTTFQGLADPTRRAILPRLAEEDATVTEPAKPFPVNLPAASRHLKVLERAGLIYRNRPAQFRPSSLRAEPLRPATARMETYREMWDRPWPRLDEHLRESRTDRAMTDSTPVQTAEQEITNARVFDAPRQ
jgi:DNA-binding transcriptional ArsR family regulator